MVIFLGMAFHEVSDYIDSIKECLTDAMYKEGMDLCKKLFDKKASDRKLYRMTYLRPFTFMDNHCHDEDCGELMFFISFTKVTTELLLVEKRVREIQASNMFKGTLEDMKEFIDVEVLRSFPNDLDDLGSDIQWYEFPVISLEEVQSEEPPHAPPLSVSVLEI